MLDILSFCIIMTVGLKSRRLKKEDEISQIILLLNFEKYNFCSKVFDMVTRSSLKMIFTAKFFTGIKQLPENSINIFSYLFLFVSLFSPCSKWYLANPTSILFKWPYFVLYCTYCATKKWDLWLLTWQVCQTISFLATTHFIF